MTRFALPFAALAATACVSLSAAAMPLGKSDRAIHLAQTEVTVTETAPADEKVIVRKRPVHERVVVAHPGCRMVTTRIHDGGKVIVKKVRRCG